MKDVLHFFGEFIVEGTVGSSVFKNLNASGHFERGDLKPKSIKWSIHLDINSEKGTSDNVEAENLHKEQLKNVKRHRRWSIGKVGNHNCFICAALLVSLNINLISSCLLCWP